MTSNDESATIEFKRPPPELDPYKELKWFLESKPHGSNRDVVLEFIEILASTVSHDYRSNHVVRRSSDEITD